MELILSQRAMPYFDRAGWSPNRRVAVHAACPTSHPGYQILQQFGGLHVGADDRGRMLEEIRNDIVFGFGRELEELVSEWESLLGAALVGIAEVHHRHGELYVSEDGRFFDASLVHDAWGFRGASFRDAMDGLLFGSRSLPMIRPNQNSVRWYGLTYRHGDSGLYDYQKAR